METSEVVEVLCEIRDIQRKSAQFQRMALSVFVAVVIAAFGLFSFNFVPHALPLAAVALFYGGWVAFLVACGILVSALIRHLRHHLLPFD